MERLKPRLCGLASPRGNCYGRHVSDWQSFDGFASDYDRFSRLEQPGVLNWLLSRVPAHAGRALDAGCGSGRHTQALARQFSSTTLHHVLDLDTALLHLRSLLRPSGIAILVDNVASRPTPPRWVHVLGALRDVPGDIARVGTRKAGWLLKFRTSRAWLKHLASDRYLTRQAFEHQYGAIFPEARFESLGYAHGLVWEKKNPAAVARGHEVRREP